MPLVESPEPRVPPSPRHRVRTQQEHLQAREIHNKASQSLDLRRGSPGTENKFLWSKQHGVGVAQADQGNRAL